MSAAIIFDMDELLVDSKPIWRAAESALFESMGHRYDEQTARIYKGKNAFDVAAALHALLRPPGEVAGYQQIMRLALLDEYAKGQIVPMDGAVEMVRRLHGVAPMAVASGSPLEGIELAMGRLGIRQCMGAIVSSESVPRGKPHPDVFLKAADLLGAAPRDCLVFEDSITGVRAALAGGMKVFAVPSLSGTGLEQVATRTFGSLRHVTVEDVREALGQMAA